MKKPKLKYVNEWDIDKKSKRVVKKELKNWSKEFAKRGNDKLGGVRNFDLKDNKWFFFTDCRDIISDEAEQRPQEKHKQMTDRKSNVLLALSLKQLSGDKITTHSNECSHCGYEQVDYVSTSNGHFTWCPQCTNIVMNCYWRTCDFDFKDMAMWVNEEIERLKATKSIQ